MASKLCTVILLWGYFPYCVAICFIFDNLHKKKKNSFPLHSAQLKSVMERKDLTCCGFFQPFTNSFINVMKATTVVIVCRLSQALKQKLLWELKGVT